jgi:hypothetical protein
MNIHISKSPSKSWSILFFVVVLFVALVIDFPVADTPHLFLVKNVEAIVGAPATPGSVGGVHRRTRQRTRRRVAVGTRVYTLPGGCTPVIKGGVTYYQCGGVYYRPYYEGSKVVYVVENP